MNPQIEDDHCDRDASELKNAYNEDGGAGGDEADKLVIERLALVLTVVLLSEVLGGDNKLHSDELETSLFPAGEDFTNLNDTVLLVFDFYGILRSGRDIIKINW